MVIEWILWLPEYEEKIAVKHGVDKEEVEEALYGETVIRRIGRGRQAGEDLYLQRRLLRDAT